MRKINTLLSRVEHQIRGAALRLYTFVNLSHKRMAWCVSARGGSTLNINYPILMAVAFATTGSEACSILQSGSRLLPTPSRTAIATTTDANLDSSFTCDVTDAKGKLGVDTALFTNGFHVCRGYYQALPTHLVLET